MKNSDDSFIKSVIFFKHIVCECYYNIFFILYIIIFILSELLNNANNNNYQ